jgi:hypothetical protein
MASKVEIINVALSRLGANIITSADENSTEAIVANALWDNARRSSITDHPWNFAIAEQTLNAVSDASSFNYQFKYQLPAECLRVMEVYDTDDYKIIGHGIYSNETECVVRFVKDVEDTTEWNAMFTDVMAQRLAAEMAYAITKSQATADTNIQMYGQKLAKARFVDASEEPQDALGDRGFVLNARF